MREILFRGKRRDNREWVYGCYYKQTEFCGDKVEPFGIMIITSSESLCYDQALEYYAISEKTVGQFTGLTDKNGKKIFEGDIIEWFAQGESERPDFGYIEYDEQSFAWRVCWQKYDPDWLEGMQSQYITVIGNVFDNKDLLS